MTLSLPIQKPKKYSLLLLIHFTNSNVVLGLWWCGCYCGERRTVGKLYDQVNVSGKLPTTTLSVYENKSIALPAANQSE